MLIASVIGAAGGIYYNAMLNPLNNYFAFLVVFALIGIAIGNVAMLVLYKVYEWFEQRYPAEEAQNAFGS